VAVGDRFVGVMQRRCGARGGEGRAGSCRLNEWGGEGNLESLMTSLYNTWVRMSGTMLRVRGFAGMGTFFMPAKLFPASTNSDPHSCSWWTHAHPSLSGGGGVAHEHAGDLCLFPS
jgi:hypothetical protein